GRVATAMRYSKRSDGVYGGFLDSAVPDSGGARCSRLPGQRAPREECTRPQDRCRRLSVAAVSSCRWSSPCLASSSSRHLRPPIPLATPREPRANGGGSHPAYAESTRPDEYSTASRYQ